MKKGFLVVEVLLAAALFVTFATGMIAAVISGWDANRRAGEQTVAMAYVSEGLEAVRSIKNQDFANLLPTPSLGVARSAGGVWSFSGSNNATDSGRYTRVVSVEDVNRDASGNIVLTGTPDPSTKKVTSSVAWDFTTARPQDLSVSTYMTNWRAGIGGAARGGMLVYGNGGTTSDAIAYKVLDSSGNWGVAQATAVDPGTTNRYLRSARVFTSATRNEKVLVTRHYDAASQYIYAQVYNGASWGNEQLLSSWAATNFLDVRNFDGAYLNSGDFMVVYRDGTTTIPKYRIWNGTSWSAQADTANVGGVANYMVVEVRPGTDEVMLATYDAGSDTNTAYYNGSSWTTATEHAAVGPTTTKEHISFIWSVQNPLKGALVYPALGTDTTENLKIFTADGSGGGSWSGTVDSGASGGRLGAINLDRRLGAEEFISCHKDASADIYCFRADTTPAWSSPANNILTTTSDTGTQRSFDMVYERSGDEGVAVYSINTAIPKYRLYTASANSFGSEANLLTGTGSIGSSLETVRMRRYPDNDDIMVLMANTVQDLYSVVWNGSTNSVYTSGGFAQTTHGLTGSNDLDFWFDFAWDRF